MNIINWFKQSHRWQHLVGGMLVGLGANDIYCAVYVGLCVAGALEFKDYQTGGKPELFDFCLTLAGVQIGFAIRLCITKLL